MITAQPKLDQCDNCQQLAFASTHKLAEIRGETRMLCAYCHEQLERLRAAANQEAEDELVIQAWLQCEGRDHIVENRWLDLLERKGDDWEIPYDQEVQRRALASFEDKLLNVR